MKTRTYKCTQCGEPFEGTGKVGRPFQRCPACRGLRPILLDGGTQSVSIRPSNESGVCAVMAVKDTPRGGYHEVKLGERQVVATLGALANAAQARRRAGAQARMRRKERSGAWSRTWH